MTRRSAMHGFVFKCIKTFKWCLLAADAWPLVTCDLGYYQIRFYVQRLEVAAKFSSLSEHSAIREGACSEERMFAFNDVSELAPRR